MYDSGVAQRVTDLEAMMAQVWRTIDRVDRQIENTQRQIENTQRQIENTQRHLDQLSWEMHEFKEEMRAFKDEMGRFKVEMNRKWGELANRMGTMAEDLVAPSVPRILRETVGCPDDHVESTAVRVRRLHPTDRSQEREFDVVAVCGEYLLINETRSRLSPQLVEDFVQRLPQAREFFPEYADKKLIGAIASLYVDESVVRTGEKLGVIVLGFGQDVMEVLNAPGFVPKTF